MNPTKLIRIKPINPIHITIEEKLKNIEKNNNPSNNNATRGPITKIKLDIKPSFLPDSNDILTKLYYIRFRDKLLDALLLYGSFNNHRRNFSRKINFKK